MNKLVAFALALLAANASAVPHDLASLEPIVIEQLREAERNAERTTSDPTLNAADKASRVGMLGHLYHTYDLLDVAADAYAKASKFDAKSFVWPYASGVVAGKQRDYNKASEYFQRARLQAETVNQRYLANIRLGETYSSLNDPDNALIAYSIALELGTGGAAVHARLGELYLATADYEKSISHLTRALSINPKANQLHYALALAHRGLGNRDLVVHHLSRRGKVTSAPADPLPSYLDSLLKGYRGHIVAGRIALSGERYAEAGESLNKAIAADASQSYAWVLLAEANVGQNKLQEAVTNLEEALRVNPADLTASSILGNLLVELDDSDKAIPYLEGFAQANPYSASALLSLAHAYQQAGRIDDAITVYDRALELDDTLVNGWLDLILLLTDASQHRLALEKSELAARTLPYEPKILARLVFSLAASPDQAVRNGVRAVEVAERLFELETAYITARLVGISHAEAGNCEPAIEWLQRSIALAESNWQHQWVSGPVQRTQVLRALQRNHDAIANSPVCTDATKKSDNRLADNEHPGRAYALRYCQTCHLFVEPAIFPKHVWQDYVIPQMGAFLGMHHAGYDYDVFPGKLPTEKEIIDRANVYPDVALVPTTEWALLTDYFLDSAPLTPPSRDFDPTVGVGLKQFRVTRIGPSRETPMTTLVHIDNGQLFVGDYQRSSLTVLDADGKIVTELSTPHAPINLRRRVGELWLTDIGSVFPSDMPYGKVLASRKEGGRYSAFATRLTKLQRPTHTTYGDVNQDGIEDLVVSEFGHFAGRLVWYEGRTDGGYVPHVLLSEPGAITSYLRDLNGDGRDDIAAVFGQSREGVHIFYNLGEGSFRHSYALPLPPYYGSNYFALHDFNSDGHPDILATNGDNADHVNPFPKNHHGIRIYLNDGRNSFTEQFFFPLYGASKALAVDFDADGDLDIAGIAMFADFKRRPDAGFVYLENQGELQFTAAHIPEAADGRWLTMDAGDLDGDDDIDIVLGSFIQGPGEIPTVIMQRWTDLKLPLLYLQNQLK